MNELDIFNVPLPQKTDTYIPVSHEYLINEVKEQLDKKGLSVERSKYYVSHGGNRLIGYYDIRVGGNEELGLRLGFRNSYDKSMSVAIVSGAQVWICSNGLVSSDGISFIRKHTGNVIKEVNQTIKDSMSQLEDTFLGLARQVENMKNIGVSKKDAASLYGRAFLLSDLFSLKQLISIKNELNKPTFPEFKEDSLWSVYNHATYVLRDSGMSNYLQQHIEWHKYIREEFGLVHIKD